MTLGAVVPTSGVRHEEVRAYDLHTKCSVIELES